MLASPDRTQGSGDNENRLQTDVDDACSAVKSASWVNPFVIAIFTVPYLAFLKLMATCGA